VRCIECGLRQLVRKYVVVVSIAVFRLIEYAVPRPEHGRIAERLIGKAHARRELRLIGVGNVVGDACLVRRLNQISEMFIRYWCGVLRAQVDRVAMTAYDNRLAARWVKGSHLILVGRKPWRVFITKSEIECEPTGHVKVILAEELIVGVLAAK